MDTRKPKKPPVCEALGLGDVLESFKSGPFPREKDVLLHFFFHLRAMKKPHRDAAAWSTAEAILLHWEPSSLPLMTRKNAKAKVKQLYNRFAALRDLNKDLKVYAARKAAFLAALKERFDCSAKDALNIISANKTLLPAEKAEDKSFLLAIRDNRPHSLGPLDVKWIERLKRSAEREQDAQDRAEKEKQRKEVRSMIRSMTLLSD